MKYLSNTAAGDFRGYKPRSTGELSSRDNDERYNIPKFTKEHEREHPQLIKDYYEEIKEFSLVSFLLFALLMLQSEANLNCSAFSTSTTKFSYPYSASSPSFLKSTWKL